MIVIEALNQSSAFRYVPQHSLVFGDSRPVRVNQFSLSYVCFSIDQIPLSISCKPLNRLDEPLNMTDASSSPEDQSHQAKVRMAHSSIQPSETFGIGKSKSLEPALHVLSSL
jgi:hypothetical protein